MKKTASYIRAMAPAVGWRCFFWYSLLIGLYLSIDFVHPIILSADSGVSYQVTIEGFDHQETRKLLEAVSEAINLRERPPASLNLLRRRVNEDIPRFLNVLKSQGFYGARVTFEINPDAEPAQVIFRIDSGPTYLLKSVEIKDVTPNGQEVHLPTLQKLGLALERPAQSKPILDAGDKIIAWFKGQGFPFSKIAERKVVVDHATKDVYVTFIVQPGPRARFGSTEIKGLESVDETFVRSKIAWKEGERFNAELLTECRKNLIHMGLFSTVQVKAGQNLDQGGLLPVFIEVKERKHRTVKAGASFKTDEGPGGKISWEHRNLFRHGEGLNLSGAGSGIGFATEGRFRRPEFLRTDQALLLNIRLAEDRPDAYISRNITSMVEIERTLSKGMDLAAGLAYRFSRIDQLGKEENFRLFSLPTRFDWDTSDNILDATRGGHLNLQLAPYYDTYGENLTFLKGYARYSRYVTLSQAPHLVLALRGTMGAINGAERDEIPADIRFYAGGGGSIRGYAYQSVGPLRQGEPIGGRSLVGFTSELRIRVTEKMGFVPFLDGGNVFEGSSPDFGEKLLWGAGLGFRYFTPIGPLRMDIGFPLDRREGIDDAFQVYVSLGQAF
ncbi:MAG: autotransporter assembly complex family protein [Pseudomonadota bacterium]